MQASNPKLFPAMSSSTDGSHLKLVLWNVKGLRSPHKCISILRHLWRLRADVALLQETHLSTDDLTCLQKMWVGSVYGSPAVGRKAGVAILLHKHLRHTVRDVRVDSVGRKITLHLTLGEKLLLSQTFMLLTHLTPPSFKIWCNGC